MQTKTPPWLVLYTKPQQERKLALRLQKLGFEVYCPVRKTVKQWSDRKKKVEEPLFKSYLFIKMFVHQRDEIVWVPGFSGFVFWLGKPAMVRQKEIEAVEQFLGKVNHDSIAVQTFEKGQHVKINSGPLAQQSGVVLRVSKNKVTLLIESLGTVIQAELAAHALSV